uniref:Uncharacterized protein n=1 Tax=Pelagomonas calceolata TaxID=35677 RepID=A0A6S8WYC8_9STRA
MTVDDALPAVAMQSLLSSEKKALARFMSSSITVRRARRWDPREAPPLGLMSSIMAVSSPSLIRSSCTARRKLSSVTPSSNCSIVDEVYGADIAMSLSAVVIWWSM